MNFLIKVSVEILKYEINFFLKLQLKLLIDVDLKKKVYFLIYMYTYKLHYHFIFNSKVYTRAMIYKKQMLLLYLISFYFICN